jgi:Uma2 family endonuclease
MNSLAGACKTQVQSTNMSVVRTISPEKAPAPRHPYPLAQGDHLSRDEFERRYAAAPNGVKAELIEGVVYMAPPVSQENHGGPHFDLIFWMGHYRAAVEGVRGGDNSSLRLDLKNEPQPDAFLYLLSSHGGQARIDEDGYVVGAPEVIAEVSASSASYDLHVKSEVYLRNGVKEYIVWRVLDQTIDWMILRHGEFVKLSAGVDGIYRSERLAGLWLDSAALIRGDLATVVRIQQQGLASAEHIEFAKRLEAAAISKAG